MEFGRNFCSIRWTLRSHLLQKSSGSIRVSVKEKLIELNLLDKKNIVSFLNESNAVLNDIREFKDFFTVNQIKELNILTDQDCFEIAIMSTNPKIKEAVLRKIDSNTDIQAFNTSEKIGLLDYLPDEYLCNVEPFDTCLSVLPKEKGKNYIRNLIYNQEQIEQLKNKNPDILTEWKDKIIFKPQPADFKAWQYYNQNKHLLSDYYKGPDFMWEPYNETIEDKTWAEVVEYPGYKFTAKLCLYFTEAVNEARLKQHAVILLKRRIFSDTVYGMCFIWYPDKKQVSCFLDYGKDLVHYSISETELMTKGVFSIRCLYIDLPDLESAVSNWVKCPPDDVAFEFYQKFISS